MYVGSASGGVWRSLDGGTTFRPVFDKQPVQSIGAVAIDPSQPEDGLGRHRRELDAQLGLDRRRHLQVHRRRRHVDATSGCPSRSASRRSPCIPTDGQTVYACVPGKLWSDSTERGLYKTTDGGKTWALVLKGGNPSTGCASVSLDPKAPEPAVRQPVGLPAPGLDVPLRRRVARRAERQRPVRVERRGADVVVARRVDREGPARQAVGPRRGRRRAVRPEPRVRASSSAPRSALFVSDDGGKTFEERDRSQMMVWRPFYFANLIVDPKNTDRVFKAGGGLIVSNDGGRSFSGAAGGSHGDWHDVWINPENTQHLIGGDDGGLWISYDGGEPLVEGRQPADLAVLPRERGRQGPVPGVRRPAGQQLVGRRLRSTRAASPTAAGRTCTAATASGRSPIPTDPDFVYAEMQGGYIGRVNRRTLEARDIQPKAGKGEKLRFNWNTPIHLSPNEKGTLYIGAQFLFRSRDHGQTWDRISPDLTTNDPAKQQQEQSGGVTVDNSAAEMHTTIYSISESPKNARRIWVGTDDGNVQVTRDGGKTWTNVGGNVPGVPAGSWISWVEASRFDEKRAYVAFDRHTFGDMTPYVYRTDDDGQTWQRIAGPEQGLRGYAHVIREDVVSPDLLFAGHGVRPVDLDRRRRRAGRSSSRGTSRPSPCAISWCSRAITISCSPPTAAASGSWTTSRRCAASPATCSRRRRPSCPARPVQQRIQGSGGWPGGDASFSGDNPESGAVITYYQRTRHLFGPIRLEVLDATGEVVDTIPASARRGINRVAWSMRVKPPEVPPAAQLAQAGFNGPRVLPGRYTVRLTKGDKTYETDAGRRARSPRHVHRGGPKGAVRGGDARPRALRVHDGTRAPHQRGCERRPTGRLPVAAGGGSRPPATVEALAAKADEVRKRVVATTEGRRHHRRGTAPRARRPAVRRDPVVRGSSRGLPAAANRRADERARRRGVRVSRRAEGRALGRQRCAQEEEAGGDRGALTNQDRLKPGTTRTARGPAEAGHHTEGLRPG